MADNYDGPSSRQRALLARVLAFKYNIPFPETSADAKALLTQLIEETGFEVQPRPKPERRGTGARKVNAPTVAAEPDEEGHLQRIAREAAHAARERIEREKQA